MSEDKYRTLFESIDEGFCVIEVLFDDANNPVDYRFLEVNRVFEQQAGISNAVGRRIREIVPSLEEHWFQTYGQVALTGEPRRFEYPAVALGRFYDVYAFRIGSPAQHQVAVLFKDISERRQAEVQRAQLIDELRAAQALLRADLEATSRLLKLGSLFLQKGHTQSVLGEIVDAAIAICGADFGAIQVVNRTSGKLEFVAQRGFPEWYLNFWAETGEGHGACGTALARLERVIVEDVESSPLFAATPALQVQLKAGVRAVQSTPLLARTGEIIGVLSTHWNRPARPDARALRHLDLLARQVADMLERVHAEQGLERANQRLVEADRRKDDFLAMLSHELRNPLAPIRNGLHILERAPAGSEQALRAQAIMARQIEHMTRIIDDLLDLTRVTHGSAVLRRERLDLVQLTQRAVEDYRALFDESGITLAVRAAPAEVWVHGDRTRLTQVIGNLLQNAAKFTPRAGNASVAVGTDVSQGRAFVQVEDNGRGISSEMLPRVFEAFAQADTSIDRSGGGLGLGLAVVDKLVQMHGGTVRAQSVGLGQGATFRVELPLDTTIPAPSTGLRAAIRTEPRRVLIIEDSIIAALSFSDALALEGHEVEVAANGQEGLEKARSLRPDVVFCDIGLPGMDGYEVARAMRADPALSHTWLVALTGYSRAEDVVQTRAAGFDAHLAKPASPEAVAQLLANSADGRLHQGVLSSSR